MRQHAAAFNMWERDLHNIIHTGDGGGAGRRSQCVSFDLMCEGAAGSVGPFKLGGLET